MCYVVVTVHCTLQSSIFRFRSVDGHLNQEHLFVRGSTAGVAANSCVILRGSTCVENAAGVFLNRPELMSRSRRNTSPRDTLSW